jgi:fructokinase
LRLNKQGIVSLGEAFIDNISIDETNSKFQQLLGGATVNVSVGASRLGVTSYYLCKLGIDAESLFVENQLKTEKVNTDYCIRTPNKKICQVQVYLNQNGERYFNSYINPTPDQVMLDSELGKELFTKAKIFYFGSGTLFQSNAKQTTEKAIKFAKDADTIVAFDPNIRLMRWENEDICRRTIIPFLKKADIVKLAEEELLFLTETNLLEDGLDQLSQWRVPYTFITMGEKGSIALYGKNKIHVPVKKVKAIDTTGAGDAFMSALLYCFHDRGMHLEGLKDYLQFANEMGAIATTEFGALKATSSELINYKINSSFPEKKN